MNENSEISVAAVSALAGAAATIIQELAASGAIDVTRLRQRLENYVKQDAVEKSPEEERVVIKRIIDTLISGLEYGVEERDGNGKS